MKKAMLIGLVLALGLLALGCDSGGGGGGGAGNPYYGTTWDSAEGSLAFTQNEWIMLETSGEGTKGTYTYSGATITFTETHRTLNSGASWTAIPAGEARSFTGTVSGDSLSMQGGHGTFGKRASGGGGDIVNPYVNTAWASDSGHVLLFTSAAEWIWTEPDGKRDKGTYIFSGNTVTLTQTDYSADLEAPWLPVTPDMGVTPDTGVVSNNTLIFASKPDRIMYKQSAGQGGGGGLPESPYSGTLWISDRGVGLMSFTDYQWTIEYHDGYDERGTYTLSDSNINFTLTHGKEDSGAGWMTVAELEAMYGPIQAHNKNFTGNVSGGSLTIPEWMDETYTKLIAAPGAPPEVLVPEIDLDLIGPWAEHVEGEGEPIMYILFSDHDIMWDGPAGAFWKTFFDLYQSHDGFDCAWFATGASISYKVNYYGSTVQSEAIYNYSFNEGGQLILTPMHGDYTITLDRQE